MLPTMIDAAFHLTATHPVPALGVTLETWKHPCGAVHYHLACDDDHRAFVVGFRTLPQDSTGLPHILEHTTLAAVSAIRYAIRFSKCCGGRCKPS
jgi:Zn-dependent M16 (insulinase) family peptidase